jgi:hypothetical protein
MRYASTPFPAMIGFICRLDVPHVWKLALLNQGRELRNECGLSSSRPKTLLR